MFKKNKKQTETIKEKKVRTVKVGTHQKTVIALWVVLIASVSFGVYKNFTAIDQHTTHEKEREKQLVLEETMDAIRNKFGFEKIQRCSMKLDQKLTDFDPKHDHIIHPVSFF